MRNWDQNSQTLRHKHHSLVFPDLPGRPYKPFRHDLYSPEELFEGFEPENPETYFSTMDWFAYTSYIKVDEHRNPLQPDSVR